VSDKSDPPVLKKSSMRWADSTIWRSLSILSRADKRKVAAVTILQVGMAGLDLLGVLAIGLLGALSVTGLQANSPGNEVGSVVKFLGLSNWSFQVQATIIGIAALVLLVGRTILSIFFTRRILFFLSRRGAKVSANLISRLLAQPLLVIQARTTQESLYALTTGVTVITMGILAAVVVLISDVSLLLVLAFGLFVVDPITSFGTFVFFMIIGFILYRSMHLKASALGAQSSKLNITSNEKIVEVLSSYRESVVRNRRDFYAREIGMIRFSLADANAEMGFMPYVSKYVIETSVVLGAILISAVQFVLQDATHAVATLAIFLAAGTRIAPAVLRVQQSTISIRANLGQAMPTLDLIDTLGDSLLVENVDDAVDVIHEGFESGIQITNVSLTYPSKSVRAISNISLEIPPGASIAIVGPSGAGKTTLVDLLLGVLYPDEGTILVSGLPPLSAVTKWPGAVSYVPQDVQIAAGTIRENIALGYPSEAATDELVMSALRVAHLDKFVEDLPDGIDTQVGERGAKISGGQRQRLGIARAMFTRPHLLVLDEATSSLDGETEADISNAIHALRGSTTVVLIAHRLSTVRNVDIVAYLSDGEILALGTFNEVRGAVPDFDRQAKLMGL
jgi:ABC-type multidrug transport system fused ATPase/permease subunit